MGSGGERRLCALSAETSAQVPGPGWVPQGPAVFRGSRDSQHPDQGWPAPWGSSTEKASEKQAGCRPDATLVKVAFLQVLCESGLRGPALPCAPCSRPAPSFPDAGGLWPGPLRQQTPTLLLGGPSTASEPGDPVDFPSGHTSPDLISCPASLWDDRGSQGGL